MPPLTFNILWHFKINHSENLTTLEYIILQFLTLKIKSRIFYYLDLFL